MSINIEKVREFLRHKEDAADRTREKLLGRARKDFEVIVNLVIEKGNPTEIWQWGSVLTGDFWDYSDIDIAITGLEYRKFIALAELCQINELKARITNTKKIHKKIENEFNIFLEHSLPLLGKNNQSALILTTVLEKYYTTLETCFFRISKFFENSLSRESWHKELLDKMRLEIPDTREAVIQNSSYSELQELLRFRHFSRYYTEMDYDWNRLDIFLNTFPTLCKTIEKDLDGFFEFLDTLQAQSG